MDTWKRLAVCLQSEQAFCRVLMILRADARTHASMMVYAIKAWREGEARAVKRHGFAWRPCSDYWLALAQMIALVRTPMPTPVVQELRTCLIVCGRHEDLLELDRAYGISTSDAEFRQLADLLRAGDHKYEWSRWDALLEAPRVQGDPPTHRYIADKKASAVLEHNTDI